MTKIDVHPNTTQVDFESALTWMDSTYDMDRPIARALFQKSKQRNWDPADIAPELVDLSPDNPLGMPMRTMPVMLSPWFQSMSPLEQNDMRFRFQHWLVSQFLHIEQLGLLVCTKLAQRLPSMADKMFAVAQALDEAKHVEVYCEVLARFGSPKPLSTSIGSIYDQVLSESEWDFMLLGNQIMIEGLGLSVFGQIRDATSDPRIQRIHQYICDDESRHFAFGRHCLQDIYADLSDAEISHREEFLVEAFTVLKERVSGVEFWRAAGMPEEECNNILSSPAARLHRIRVFSKVIPALSDIGLWTPRLAEKVEKLGIRASRTIAPKTRREHDG